MAASGAALEVSFADLMKKFLSGDKVRLWTVLSKIDVEFDSADVDLDEVSSADKEVLQYHIGQLSGLEPHHLTSRGALFFGAIYTYGLGVPKNIETANKYLLHAAANDEAEAYTLLVINEGVLDRLDPAKSLSVITGLITTDDKVCDESVSQETQDKVIKGVQLGDSEACTLLAAMRMQGIGVNADLVEAKKYAEMAVARGSQVAPIILSSLRMVAGGAAALAEAKALASKKKNPAELARTFRRSAQMGDVKASEDLKRLTQKTKSFRERVFPTMSTTAKFDIKLHSALSFKDPHAIAKLRKANPQRFFALTDQEDITHLTAVLDNEAKTAVMDHRFTPIFNLVNQFVNQPGATLIILAYVENILDEALLIQVKDGAMQPSKAPAAPHAGKPRNFFSRIMGRKEVNADDKCKCAVRDAKSKRAP